MTSPLDPAVAVALEQATGHGPPWTHIDGLGIPPLGEGEHVVLWRRFGIE